MQATLERLRARREERGDEGGFTLIELLIVIVILGILAAIVVFAVQNLTSSSAQSSCKADFKNVETAAEAYKAQMTNYPSGSATQNTGPGSGAGTDTTVSSPTTDNQLGAPVAYVVGFAPGAVDNNTIASSSVTAANIAADTTAAPNAAASGGELLVQGNTAPNTVSASANAGPWLKDAPVNTGHYSIFAANDGSGTVAVLDGSGKYLGNSASACSSIS